MSLTPEQALDCFASDDLIGIGMEADAVRRRLHPERVVSYSLDGAVACAGLCAGSDPNRQIAATAERVEKIASAGATGVVLDQICVPVYDVERLEAALRGLKRRFPLLWLQALTASELLTLTTESGMELRDLLNRLREAGLDAISSEDALLLDDAVRQRIAPAACSSREWIATHRAAHTAGLASTAMMAFGAGESPDQRVQHLSQLRGLQAETGGFVAFAPVVFGPAGARAAAGQLDEPTAVECLKTLAVSRMVLDTIEHVQGTAASTKVLQMGLRFGCDDMGTVSAMGNVKGSTEEELRRIARDAGFMPVQRDLLFRRVFLA